MKVIIIGAGIGGLTAAIALQQRGISFELYEAAPELKAVGAGIWLGGNAMNVYERLELAAEIKAHSVFLESVYIKDINGRLLQHVDNLAIQRLYGNGTQAIYRGKLQQILVHALHQPVQLNKRCTQINGNMVLFEDGSTATGDVIIGADGIRSVVREQCITHARYRYSGQTCWRAMVNMTLPQEEQVNSGEIWGNSGGVRASYSQVGPGQVYFWITKAMPAGSRLGNEEAYTFIKEQLTGFNPLMQTVVNHIQPEQLIHGDLFDIKPIASWYKHNVVLLGDAAHASTPNLGQGASQAIEDAYILAACLSTATSPESAFKKYQHKRMPRAKRVVNMSWILGRLTALKGRRSIRLRNWFIRHTPHRIARSQFHFLYGVNLNVDQ